MPIHTSSTIPSHSLLAFARYDFWSQISAMRWLYGIVLVLSFVIRFAWLDTLPLAVTHDEVFYANQARALTVMGTDQSGVWKPQLLTSAHPLFAEWPGVVMVPGFWLFPNQPLLAYRFSYAVAGSLLPLLVALLSWQLFGKKKLSFIVFCLATFNPWMIQISRQGFDITFSLFFFLSGTIVLLAAKKWWKLIALLFFVLGFFQYMGGKVLALPLIGLTTLFLFAKNFFAYDQPDHDDRTGLVAASLVLAASAALVVWFGIHLNSQVAVSRTNDIILFSLDELGPKVDALRKATLPSALTPFIYNKATVLVSELSAQFVRSIDLTQFFVKGEPTRNPTTVWTHGMFYALDAILILIGFTWLFVHPQWKFQKWYVVGLLIISTLPQVINTKDTWIFLRLGLLYPLLVLVSGLGFAFVWKFFKPALLIRSILVVGYTFSFLLFLYHLAVVSPVTATTDKYFAERILASYVQRLGTTQPVAIHVDESRFIFEELVFYSKVLTADNAKELAKAFQTEHLVFRNWRVSTDCYDLKNTATTVLIKDQSVVHCARPKNDSKDTSDNVLLAAQLSQLKLNAVEIRSPYSGENRFLILNDSLCTTTASAALPPLTKNVLQVELLNDAAFCQAFIVKKVF